MQLARKLTQKETDRQIDRQTERKREVERYNYLLEYLEILERLKLEIPPAYRLIKPCYAPRQAYHKWNSVVTCTLNIVPLIEECEV